MTVKSKVVKFYDSHGGVYFYVPVPPAARDLAREGTEVEISTASVGLEKYFCFVPGCYRQEPFKNFEHFEAHMMREHI